MTQPGIKTKLYDYKAMAKTAVKHPDRIPPFIQKQWGQLPGRTQAWLATQRQTRGLHRQIDLLNELRSRDNYLLIVLDACRFDYFDEQFDRYFAGDCTPAKSAGHDTFEYGQRCWHRRHADGDQHDVTYVSGATPINSEEQRTFDDVGLERLYRGWVPNRHISDLIDAWRIGWDESLGVIPPENLLKQTLPRLHEPRLVAHFFQPHTPYIGDEQMLGHANNESSHPDTGDPVDKPIWEAIKAGEVSADRLRELYKSNLECVLPTVARLVAEAPHDNIVILGDHGEALGEYGMYAHQRVEHPKIRRVPWACVNGLTQAGQKLAEECAGDVGGTTDSGTEDSVKNTLEALGYLE